MNKALFFLVAASLLSAGCIFVVHDHDGSCDWSLSGPVVQGSGVEVRSARTVPAFHRIESHDFVDVDVKIGEPQSVTVRADDNLESFVETSVSGGVLHVRWRSPNGSGSSTSVSPRVEIVVPALDAVELGGSGDARIEGLHGSSFAVELSGSGDVRASGAVERLSVSLSGSGDASLFGLEARTVDVSVSGSGDAEVNARESLSVDISGSGDVDYRGDPKSVKRDISGSGDLDRSGG